METFCEYYGLKKLIKVSTCHKNPQNPSCIDLILTNSPLSFQSSGVIETGLSDFHKIIVSHENNLSKIRSKNYTLQRLSKIQ